jgi:hypothetical protein
MDPRHRTKAFTGAGIWFGIPLTTIALTIFCVRLKFQWAANMREETSLMLVGIAFLIQYFSFFWTCHHLAKARGYSTALMIFGIFPPGQLVILVLLLWVLPDKCPTSSQHRKPKQYRDESHIARIVRYRRNALAGNLFGLFGIFFALALFFLPVHLSDDPSVKTVAAIFIFLAGYAGVITGCWWWAKAKCWIDAVVFIGLVPLAVLCIRWVRLIYVAVPLLLPVSMVMAPLILIVVIASLPDRSGMQKKR